ncbi:LruC domain-containing protein [Vibrio sp. vnigr-6D03]|uniref:LruC domain-containing protein n=1 Tax=Vibrio sp. vnigr-6D03 TaxID=2058088 RepID=UPI000C31E781|nr:LruC domain-containing protein [Vibrio sp. vnigr-6D03]PKF79582.1 LruC domain-containing protein [Vibrio sp. vnigr-6D03]
MIIRKTHQTTWFLLSLALCSTSALGAASEDNTVTNNDGSVTITQKINANSTSPHYVAPSGYGFDIYSGKDQDYSWQHSISLPTGAQVTESTLTIYAYDIDSEPSHGENGEYDSISVDGSMLTPGFLQGTNRTWSTTVFDLPVASLSDGIIDVDLDIDMARRTWKTTLNYSLMTVTYIIIPNDPPYTPTLSRNTGTGVNEDLVVTVTGPTPADPDGDSVSYVYRWFVDVGQGYFVDDEFAGKSNNSSATLPSSETSLNEQWKVQVYAVDSNGLISGVAEITWPAIGDTDGDGVMDAEDYAPNDPAIAFYSRTPTSGWYTLSFEDQWPNEGDYDLNDFVTRYAYEVYTNADNEMTRFDYIGQAVARGASRANGFGVSLSGIEASHVSSMTKTVAGVQSSLSPESGHSGEMVFIAFSNIHDILPSNGSFSFFNTNNTDERDGVDYRVSVLLSTALESFSSSIINPFIYATYSRGTEVHLMNQPNTDLADTSLFGSGVDNSDSAAERFYQTSAGLPWALDVQSEWLHPHENTDAAVAYPYLKTWAESGGKTNTDWFSNKVNGKCWKCR